MTLRKRSWISLALLSGLFMAVYFASRLINLTGLPIFTDEAIYIRWSQIGSRDANWRFISLTDGKQPLFTWIMMVLLKILSGMDPLVIGRITSVIAGSVCLVGLWFLAYALFKNKRLAFITAFIYLVSPFTLLYDRMALYESWVSAFFVWSLYLSVLLVQKMDLAVALITGLVMGAGILNKSSGIFSTLMLPLSWLLYENKKRDNVFLVIFKWIGLALVAAVLSQAMYNILRLSPYYHMIGQKNLVFVYSFGEWLKHPVQFLYGNLRGMTDWLVSYMTWPVVALAVISFYDFRFFRRKLLLVSWWFLPFFALAMFGRVLYPRYVLFMSLPLVILAAYSFERLLQKYNHTLMMIFLSLIIFYPSLTTSLLIITQPKSAPLTYSDRSQFIDDWPAGGGIRETVFYLKKIAEKEKISVYTDGTFGLLPYALEIYLVDHENIKITGIWPMPENMPEAVKQDIRTRKTYMVLNQAQSIPSGWSGVRILEIQKGRRTDRKLRLMELLLPSDQSDSQIEPYL